MNEIKLITVWEARGLIDTSNDRGGSYSLGYFFDKESALLMGKGRGYWGGDELPIERRMATADGISGYIITNITKVTINRKINEARRKLALDKLTEEDKKLLGLVD